jgi:hypothetical protein
MKTKYEDMAEHRAFVMVPVLDERLQDIPLDTQDMLVYGFLVYRARKEKLSPTSRTKLAHTLRLDKKAADRSVHRLIRAGLAESKEGRVAACEPAGNNREWFRYRKNATGPWYGRFCYDRVYLARSSVTISVRTNCLFWHLVKIGFPLANMPGYLQAGGDKKAKWLTNEYLAKGLRCCPRTVGRGLKRLAELRLISICRRGRHNFFVGIRPLARNSSLWRKSWKAVVADNEPVTAQSLFGVPSSAELIPELRFDLAITKYLRAFRVSGEEAQKCITKILKYRIDDEVWKPLLDEAVKTHARNHASNPKAYPAGNCVFLFKHMLDERIKQDSARAELRGSLLGPRSGDEMDALGRVADYRLVREAGDLIREAVREECLPLRDGNVVPCRIHWDTVLACAKKAGKDWKTFRRLFAEQIFDQSGDPPASDWYDAWMTVEQIPDWDYSPMTTLGMDRRAKDTVLFTAKIMAKKFHDEEDTLRFRHVVNDLIRLGCWQAGSSSPSRVEYAIQDICRVLTRQSGGDRTDCGGAPYETDGYLTEDEEMSLLG